MASSATTARPPLAAARNPSSRLRSPLEMPRRRKATVLAPPTTSRSRPKFRKRTTVERTSTVPCARLMEVPAAIPAGSGPGAPTWKTNTPETEYVNPKNPPLNCVSAARCQSVVCAYDQRLCIGADNASFVDATGIRVENVHGSKRALNPFGELQSHLIRRTNHHRAVARLSCRTLGALVTSRKPSANDPASTVATMTMWPMPNALLQGRREGSLGESAASDGALSGARSVLARARPILEATPARSAVRAGSTESATSAGRSLKRKPPMASQL